MACSVASLVVLTPTLGASFSTVVRALETSTAASGREQMTAGSGGGTAGGRLALKVQRSSRAVSVFRFPSVPRGWQKAAVPLSRAS